MIFLSTTLTRVSTVGPSTLLYVATKGAIEQITRTLALELAGKGINVNCVSPGPVDTDMFKSRRTEEQLQHAKDRHPLKRIGQPEEIADVVAFLAGPDSSWVVGQNLFVNGVRVLCQPYWIIFLKMQIGTSCLEPPGFSMSYCSFPYAEFAHGIE